MIRLIKDYDHTRNSRHQAQLRSDIQSIENTLNEHDYNLKRHEASKNAHTSEQIRHNGELSVFQEIEISKKRLNNLILNADGSNVKEVVDLRVNHKGEVFNTANDRLFHTEKNIDGLYRELAKRNLMFEEYLNYQKIIFSVPARDHTRPFPQALS
ncbi:hypothetical protein JEM70_11615, partial [Bacillaceae bacterium HSR45]|nr:hypothetical protein [Bacillaceae bacterium HSR45]